MAVQVKLKDIIEGLEFLTDEGTSYLNTATGEVVYVTTEELRVTDCNQNQPGLQSPRFQDHIICLYRPCQDHIICLNWLQVFHRADATLLGSDRRQPHQARAVREEKCVGL